jgi:hypothetical protein
MKTTVGRLSAAFTAVEVMIASTPMNAVARMLYKRLVFIGVPFFG